MFGIRTSILIALLSLALGGAGGAAGCGAGANQSAQQNRQSSNNSATPTPGGVPSTPGAGESVGGDLKILSQGAHHSISEPFIAVARDAETYAELRGLDKNLPSLSADAFNGSAVVAAFLGQRRTGGYGVEITRAADGSVRVAEKTPPKGAMTTQVLTTPYKIVSVQIENEAVLKLDMDKAWREGARPYRITSGEFTMSGGFAGRSEDFRLEGNLLVMRHANLATLIFDLKSAGGAKARELKEATTGIIGAGAEVRLARFNAGSLVEPPANLLGAKGQFTNSESELALAFESLPSTVADGYQGRGRLSAVATGPPPPKTAPGGEDAM
ncbi:MAG TPA: protease complex subunit PrcB family protein [Pyrinomonadaceae bacterium]|jgi:hypothetical protein|nr:protease complex subunit PrcB family protein [Pyrinomonadaceae bacterium]